MLGIERLEFRCFFSGVGCVVEFLGSLGLGVFEVGFSVEVCESGGAVSIREVVCKYLRILSLVIKRMLKIIIYRKY